MRGWLGRITAASLGAVAGGALVKKLWLEKYRGQTTELQLAGRERDLLYTWLFLEGKGANLPDYFAVHACQKVAVLGMNRQGRRLIETLGELAAYGVELDNPSAVHETLTVYRLGDDPLPPADCLIICDLERVPEKRMEAGVEFHGKIVTLAEVLVWFLEEQQMQPRDGAIADWPPIDLLGVPARE